MRSASNKNRLHWRHRYEKRPGRDRKLRARTTRHRVYDNHFGICGECGVEIDWELKFPDPGSLSIDHIVALACGGEHSEENMQPTHLICNLRKGAKSCHVVEAPRQKNPIS